MKALDKTFCILTAERGLLIQEREKSTLVSLIVTVLEKSLNREVSIENAQKISFARGRFELKRLRRGIYK